ncbi:acyltransferase family protein [Pedobacter metabolipauper]|uniref:Peptidoglycan/LPS O-acetylase OafA/YrhL n=1 Tax=Pedobacter metabolipauper TaxID=425513 RepID=A0A4R6SX10_9SPHI|nr:acyltransferase [Pedobacter metabolipauper]TDQ09969.1 peptidoglycan/LPS O-acetylase OafA/YrhL [Pedobacter metabolipauper]
MHKNNFDLLRFIFSFMVVLAHIGVLTQGRNTIPYLGHIDSHLPVCGFFILSGFLIVRSYERTKSLKDYYIKRARRILPVYILIILVCAFSFAFISTWSAGDYFANSGFFKYLISNLTFLNFLQPCLPGVFDQNYMCAVNGSLWTLKVEVSLYLIIPLLVYLIRKIKKPIVFLALVYIIVLIHNYLLQKYIMPKNFNLYFTLSHQLPALMTYFISGMFLHFYFDWIMKHKTTLFLIALPIFIVEYSMGYQYLLPITLSLILFYLGYSTKLKCFNNFGRFGDFSYGIYIFHFPLIQLFIHFGFFDFDQNKWLSFFTLLGLVLGLGFFSWNFIEKKFILSKALPNKK